MSSYSDDITLTVTVTMRPRWMRVFLGMLEHMQYLGGIGASRNLTFMADGDGDFRPKFKWDSAADVEHVKRADHEPANRLFDAG